MLNCQQFEDSESDKIVPTVKKRQCWDKYNNKEQQDLDKYEVEVVAEADKYVSLSFNVLFPSP